MVENANDSIAAAAATFNLKAVVQETGLKPDTLRAWERRYGVPNPSRTSGGHRLYSRRDIRLLKWLIARQEAGLSISRAVDLWRRLLAENKDPFTELPVESAETTQPFVQKIPVGATLIQLRERWVKACMAYDEQSAENILTQALSMYTPEMVCFELLQWGLAKIGEAWFAGTVSAQQEHFASGLAMRRLEALLAGTPPPTRSGRILIGCAPQEDHTFSALLLTLLIRRRSWEALYLGANVPTIRLENTIAATEPILVVLTAQTLSTAANLLTMAEMLQEQDVMVAFGGLIFNLQPSICRRIPGHFLGNRLEDAPQLIEQLINSPRPHDQIKPLKAEYQTTRQLFLAMQPAIESALWELMAGTEIRPNHLARANANLSQDISAALLFGDVTLVGRKLEWIEKLLMNYNYQFPEEHLHHYLQAYATAIEKSLGERGKIIVKWLNTLLDNAANRS